MPAAPAGQATCVGRVSRLRMSDSCRTHCIGIARIVATTGTIYEVTVLRRFPILPLVLCVPLASAGDWPQFRGPEGTGVSADRGLPVEVVPQKNVIWKTALPPGHSSPILAGPRIFVTAHEGDKQYT